MPIMHSMYNCTYSDNDRYSSAVDEFQSSSIEPAFCTCRLYESKRIKMSFRTVLLPIIRVFRWSGLSPFPLLPSKQCNSVGRCDSIRYTAISVIIFLLILWSCIVNLRRYDYLLSVDSNMSDYIELFMILIPRIHTFSVLIDSSTNRLNQSRLLTIFDEIETVFAQKLNMPMEKRQLRTRFWRFIIICFVKNVAIASIFLFSVLAVQTWTSVYHSSMAFLAFYTSTLSYAQWMVYVDVIRYNIERLNASLVKMGDHNRIQRLQEDRYIFRVEIFSLDAFDTCERLIYLRQCFNKTWQASMLINRCFRWSLLFGSGNELFLLVVNLYWILYCLVNSKFTLWLDIVLCSVWAITNLSNLFVVSMLCEDIKAKVRFSSSTIVGSMN